MLMKIDIDSFLILSSSGSILCFLFSVGILGHTQVGCSKEPHTGGWDIEIAYHDSYPKQMLCHEEGGMPSPREKNGRVRSQRGPLTKYSERTCWGMRSQNR